MGWSVVMFDLPVTTKKERKTATQFRKFLLDDGYSMAQYSVYMRFCGSYETMEKHTKRLLPEVPEGGNVKVFFLTEKQWEKSINCVGREYLEKKQQIDPQQPKLFAIW
ncbi:CRISPR-associated endonuclease Cas2 [Candidatus Gracilibacteria bacterium]|nr:CRISPR-associated endonuclease Cas2 [Candidatus Gracilibacteria bacterium]